MRLDDIKGMKPLPAKVLEDLKQAGRAAAQARPKRGLKKSLEQRIRDLEARVAHLEGHNLVYGAHHG